MSRIWASLLYGVALFVVLGAGFGLLTDVAFAATRTNALLGRYFADLVYQVIFFLLVLGPLEGMAIGLMVGIRHRGDPVASFVAAFGAGAIGYIGMTLALVFGPLMWRILARVPESAGSIMPPLAFVFLVSVVTAISGGATGLIVGAATSGIKEGKSTPSE